MLSGAIFHICKQELLCPNVECLHSLLVSSEALAYLSCPCAQIPQTLEKSLLKGRDETEKTKMESDAYLNGCLIMHRFQGQMGP